MDSVAGLTDSAHCSLFGKHMDSERDIARRVARVLRRSRSVLASLYRRFRALASTNYTSSPRNVESPQHGLPPPPIVQASIASGLPEPLEPNALRSECLGRIARI
jgi:hypothetical protein